MKYYKISESDLLELLTNDLTLGHLEAGGVDNWSWYGEGRREYLEEIASTFLPKEEIAEDLDEQDVAKMIIKNNFKKWTEE